MKSLFPLRTVPGLTGLLAIGLLSNLPAPAVAPFIIAVIGDQQRPVDDLSIYPSFTVQTGWLAAHAQEENVRFVTQVGDIVEHGNDTAEFDRALAAMTTLDSAVDADGGTGVPWNVNYGNHEVNGSAPGSDPAGADADNYRDYFGSGSGTHRYANQAEFGGVSPNDLNTWHIIKSSNAVDAREYLMLNLEYDVPGHAPGSTPDPSDVPAFDAIAWAWDIIAQHPGMPTIITTHVFEGTAFGPPNNPYTSGPGRNSQLEIFDKLVKDNPQIFMVLSGHTSQDTHQVKYNATRRPVLQMVTDYNKVRANGGDGFFRLVELDEDAGEIRVKTYTPGVPQDPTPRFDTSANGEFTVAMDWATRFPTPAGPVMGAPTVDAITDDGATVEARLTDGDADEVILVWAYADQGTTDISSWTGAAGGGSHSFGAASENDTLSHVVTGLDGDTHFSFRFLATSGADSAWSGVGSFATGLGGAAAPAGLVAVAGTTATATKVDLTWSDDFTTETGFVIQRSQDSGFAAFTEFSTAVDQTSFTDNTTEPNTTYHYRIAAEGSAGAGVFSDGIEVTTTDNPGPGPTVLRGPYLQAAGHDRITIRWRTDIAGIGVVRYGTSPGVLDRSASPGTSKTEHVVPISRLAPDTVYYYEIETQNGSATTTIGGDANHLFKTHPSPGTSEPTRIWVIGDSGTTTTAKQDVYDAYRNRREATDVWLMLGDNAYNSGTDTEFQAAVFDSYPELLRNTTLWSCIGNHEAYTSGGQPYLDLHSFPVRGESGGVASGTERYYSFDHGNIHFVCIDSETSGNYNDTPGGGGMVDWLELDLQATDKDWIIAYMHHGPYTKGSHDSDTESHHIVIRRYVIPLLEQYGVDLVLSGHSHCYERSMLINGHHSAMSTADSTSGTFNPRAHVIDGGNGSTVGSVDGAGTFVSDGGDGAYQKVFPSDKVGTVYSTCGASGKLSPWDNGSTALVNPAPHPVFLVNLRVMGSMIIDIDGETLNARYIDGSNTVRDDFTIRKTGTELVLSAVAGTTLTRTKVDLTWTDSCANETGFLIQRSTDPDFASYDEFSVGANQESYTDDTTAPNTTYHYRIAETGSSGTGTFSAGVQVTTGDDPAGVPVASLIAHWSFDEGSGTTAADSSGNGLTATTTTASTWITGVSGSAVDNPKFTLSDSSALARSGTTAFTISLWAKPAANDDFAILAGFEGTGSDGDRFGLKVSGGTIQVTLGGATSTAQIETLSGPDDDWIHVVGVNDPGANDGAGVSYLYINGAEDSTGSVVDIPNSPTAEWTMGTYWNSGSYDYTGALDDVQVYDEALTATDVAFLYDNPGSPLSSVAPPFEDWATTHITDLDPTADATFGGNPDGDPFANGLEWILHGNPLGFDSMDDLLGHAADLTTGLTFSFTREDASEGGADLAVEFSSDLFDSDVTLSLVPAASGTVGEVSYTITENGSAPDDVTATIPAGKAVDGKLFGRLRATEN